MVCTRTVRYFFQILIFIGITATFSTSVLAAGSCDNYTPDVNGTTVTCNPTGSTSAGVISTQLNTAVGNNVTVNINTGTALVINGSTVGIGSGANVTNNGSLNTSSFYYGYGISAGANGRSQAGGNVITNNGSITTNGTNASGIMISAINAGSTANTITNTGTISTGGTGANGIQVTNGGAISAINNSGTIAAAGLTSNGIQVTGAANITNSGIICPSGVLSGSCNPAATGSGNGIQIDNNANTNRTTITNTNTGLIGAPSSSYYAIYSAQQPGVDIYNYGRIIGASAAATAINFAGSTSGGSNNTVTLYGGSSLLGGISFNKGNTQETLTFNGLSSSSFNNAITGLNVINAVNSSNVLMNSTGGYELVSGSIAVDGISGLEISGVIQNQTSPSAAVSSIQKTGVGILTLSGANTYSGGTSLNAGTIAVGNNAALGTGSLAMTTGTTLQAASSVALANTVSTTGTATVDTNGNNLGLSGIISGAGALTKTGTGTLTLSGANTYSGGTTVSAGTLTGNATSLQGNITNNATVDFSQASAGTYAGTMSGIGTLVKEGAGTLTLSGANTYSGGTTVSAGTLAGNTNSLQGQITNNAIVDFNQTTNGAYAGAMTGTGSLTKEGAATLTLTGANTYSGGTTVAAGTLAGNTTSVQGDIANSGTVQFTQAAAGTYAGVMSGTGNLVKEGASSLTLSGANTYSGGTSLNAGTIAVGNNAALGTGSLAMATGTTLQAASSVALANAVSTTGTATVDTNGNGLGLSGIISGTGALTKTGAGTLTLSGANTYSGGTNLNVGTIAVANNSALGTGTLIMTSGTTLQAASSVSLSNNISATGAANIDTNGNGLVLSGVISGASDVNKYGAGTLTLSGINNYSGETNINAGSVILTGSTTSNTNIASGATLQGGGTINGNVVNSGNITPSFNGALTNLTINGNYIGTGGNFTSNVYAPVTNPVADKLIISGNVTGSTGVNIIDKGGLGNRTSGPGIEVVQVGVAGSSTSNAFTLNQRVASGAFEYKLVKGDGAGTGNSWYLRTDNPAEPAVASALTTPLLTPAVGERIEVSVYPALPSLVQLYAQTAVDTLDQRRGDLNLVDPDAGAKKKSNDWARIIGKTGSSTPTSSSNGPNLNFNAYAMQLGVDLYQDEQQGGSRSYVGPYVTIGSANGNTSNQGGTTSTGNINGLQAYSAGLYATHFAQNGLYIDALAQGSRYLNANASSVQGASLRTQGSGFTGSLEGGGRWSVGKFLISPQAQVVYDAIGMSNASDAYGQMNFNKSELTRGRLGVLVGHKDVVGNTPIFAFLRASYWNVFNPGTSTTMASLYGVNPVTFQSQTGSRWMTVDGELNARVTKDTNLFLNLAIENSLMGTYQAYSGRVGIQTRF